MLTTYRYPQGDSATTIFHVQSNSSESPELEAPAASTPTQVSAAELPALRLALGASLYRIATSLPLRIDIDLSGRLIADGPSDTPLSSLDALRTALGGRPTWRPSSIVGAPVSDREARVERRVEEGCTTAQIAQELDVSERTVTSVRRKVRDRADVVAAGAASKGVSVVGPPGLARDVVHACLQALRGDVNDGGAPHLDDRVRVLVASSPREMSFAGRGRAIIVGGLPAGVGALEAVRNGVVALSSITDHPHEWNRLVDVAGSGGVELPPAMIRSLVNDLANHGVPGESSELTSRECDVIEGIRLGESTKQTARRLGLQPKTIENRRHQLYARFGVGTAQQLLVSIGPGELSRR